mmetsp:Transcript_59806/g.192492  ORF Transcript_59806/g.192492 Transcript_59806/m.192492 type:complete len:239 (-) Transcript_59806:1163-1879(-)
MVGPGWTAKKTLCPARTLLRAGQRNSRTGSTPRMPSSRTRTSWLRIWARPSACTWGKCSAWRSMASPTAMASSVSSRRTLCAGTCRRSLRSRRTSTRAISAMLCWMPSHRQNFCSRRPGCRSGPLEPASRWPRCPRRTSLWRTAAIAAALWLTRARRRTCLTTTMSSMRPRRRSSGCYTTAAPSCRTSASRCPAPPAGLRRPGHWATTGASRRGRRSSTSSRGCRSSARWPGTLGSSI